MAYITQLDRSYQNTVKAAPTETPEIIGRSGMGEKYTIGDSHSEDATTKYYKIVSWVNTAFNFKGAAAAGTPGHVQKAANGERWTDIDNHPFEKLLMKPNERDSRAEFLRDTYIWIDYGNCFWWLNKYAPDRPPSEIWILPAGRITIVPDEKQFIRAYLYDPGDGGPKIPIPPDEIVHFKGDFNPDSVFTGLGVLASLYLALDNALGMASYNAKLFKNGQGVLPGVLAFKDWVDGQAWIDTTDAIDRDAKARRILPLRGVGSGVEYVKIGSTQEEMEFMEGLVHSRDEIWAKIAPGLSSILSVNATEANAKAGRATMLDYAIYPVQVRVAEKITSDIMPLYGDNLRFEFEDVRYTDRALQIQEFDSLLKVSTVDEGREKKGLPAKGGEIGAMLYIEATKGGATSTAPTDSSAPNQPAPSTDSAIPNPATDGATSAAKAADIKAFRAYARNRVQQKQYGLIDKFEFKFVPDDEQAALFAEYMPSENAVKSDVLILAEAVNGYADRLLNAKNR